MMFRFGFVTDCTDWFIHNFMSVHEMMPNKTPEPTGIVAADSAQESSARRAAACRWLSFFR
jgi:hypothetical protein